MLACKHGAIASSPALRAMLVPEFSILQSSPRAALGIWNATHHQALQANAPCRIPCPGRGSASSDRMIRKTARTPPTLHRMALPSAKSARRLLNSPPTLHRCSIAWAEHLQMSLRILPVWAAGNRAKRQPTRVRAQRVKSLGSLVRCRQGEALAAV